MFETILPHHEVKNTTGKAFAPSNIALVKYWGKRDRMLNLPQTSSLSISLGNLGTTTEISLADQDQFILNDAIVDLDSNFANRLSAYLDHFRFGQYHFRVNSTNTVPTAAGLASSASGFAALVKALDQLFGWELEPQQLSILARVGSGSASRSLYEGFVKWHVGEKADGSDSFAEKIEDSWPEMRIGIVMIDDAEKKISSREAMNITTATAKRYEKWPDIVANDLTRIETAIADHNFERLGQIAENNALEMHACMDDATPPISFTTPKTQAAREKVWQLRASGVKVYFTQDAGPNLKLLFNQADESVIQEFFPSVSLVIPA